MSLEERIDEALADVIITPTPYLHPKSWQNGRNFLVLHPLERAEIIRRVVPLIKDNCANKAEKVAEGILAGALLPSCENPILVSEALKVLAASMRE